MRDARRIRQVLLHMFLAFDNERMLASRRACLSKTLVNPEHVGGYRKENAGTTKDRCKVGIIYVTM